MAKEILLYSGIYSFIAESVIEKMNEYIDEKVDMRLSSPGGEVFATWGICGKMTEHGGVKIKLDGYAASGAAFMLYYAEDVECWDVSRAMFHRADAYVGEDSTRRKLLDDINRDLRSKMEKRTSSEKFKQVTGVSYDELFDPAKRIDVWIDAKQMKQLGIVSKIKKLNPKDQDNLNQAMLCGNLFEVAARLENKPPKQEEEPPKQKIMTLEEFKAQHPAIYALAVSEGEKAGIAKERDRVGAWLAYNEIDSKKVADGIKKGEAITQTAMAEFQVAAMSGDFLKKLQSDSSKDIKTEGGSDPKKTALSEFEASIDKELGIKK